MLFQSSGIFIGSNPPSLLLAHNLAPTSTPSPFLVTAAGHPITVLDVSRIAIAGSTLLANAKSVTFSNVVLSLAPGGRLIVASRTSGGRNHQSGFNTLSPLVYTVGEIGRAHV